MCMSMSGYATLKYRFIAFMHPVIFSTQCSFYLIRKSESLTFLSISPYNLRANDLRRHRRHDNSQFSRSFCIYCACARRHIAVKCQRFSCLLRLSLPQEMGEMHRIITYRMRAPISCQSKKCLHKMADL